jgi:hypothetical protein
MNNQTSRPGQPADIPSNWTRANDGSQLWVRHNAGGDIEAFVGRGDDDDPNSWIGYTGRYEDIPYITTACFASAE